MGFSGQTVVSLLAPILLWVELSVVIFCVMVAIRRVSARN
jgi:hypothetical protein